MERFIKRILLVILLLIVGLGGYFVLARMNRKESLPEGLIQANGRIEGDRVTVASKFAGRIQNLLAREGDKVMAGQTLVNLDDTQAQTRVDQAQAGLAQMQNQVAQAKQSVVVVEAQLNAARTALGTLKKEVPVMIESAEAAVAQARATVTKAEAAEKQMRRDAERFRELAARGSLGKQKAELAELAWMVAGGELEMARAALAQAQAQLKNAQLGWDRIKAKEDEIAGLQAQRQQAIAAVNQARAAQSQAEATQAEAQSVRNDLTIQAPIGGVITTRVRDTGEVIAPGSPIFDLVDLGKLYLEVYIPETEIGKLRLGLPARIYVDAFPDRAFAATVRYISSRAEFVPKDIHTPDERVRLVYAVRLYLDENPEYRLTPGLPADATIRWKDDAPWMKPKW